ncbi:MAG TPA: galactokinase [Verrucomicrobia bacterium]|nr:galactokinase [Verrucomicrobiota bacterium]HCG19941.1 galactokinase [Verrucomicrobiota bacterium]
MQNQAVYDELVAKFEKLHGAKPQIVAYAPGRIEVLGNHTDYNEGYVFSAAIDKGTFFALSPSEDETCELTAADLMETAKFTTKTVAPAKELTWQNYVTGTFNWLFDGKPETAKHGFKAAFLGNIPLGAGLSSSAALEMCAVLAFSKLYGIEKDKTEMAKIGQKAEHTFAGCPCGLLDQASSMYGEEGSLVKSDFRYNTFETVPLGPTVAFMMVKTNAKHALVDGAYASRRAACEEAAKYFASILRKPVTHLRDVTTAEWILYRNGLPEVVACRSVHPIGEDERVLQGAELLNKGHLKEFGALMFDSHESSRKWFENSCEELDVVVDTAKTIPEVYGARLSGGGFGGSCCLLVDPSAADKIAATITAAYKARFVDEPQCSLIKPSAGARLID